MNAVTNTVHSFVQSPSVSRKHCFLNVLALTIVLLPHLCKISELWNEGCDVYIPYRTELATILFLHIE